MSRPALSATRSVDIIEFLAMFPQRGFTLSEIARGIDVNVASCHAVLAALSERGYLVRSEGDKTYRLGPSLIAIGQAATKAQPLIAYAKAAAERLLEALGVPVLLVTVVGEEILAISALEDAAGRDPGMRIGERLPLVAPIGAPFLAWASDAEVKAWIGRRNRPLSKALAAELAEDLELTRARGYQVCLRDANSQSIGSLMADMASRRDISGFRGELNKLVNSLDHYRTQPEKSDGNTLYDVLLIAAPIFDQSGRAVFNLCLGGFSHPLDGDTIRSYADRLMRTCLEVMRFDRVRSQNLGLLG